MQNNWIKKLSVRTISKYKDHEVEGQEEIIIITINAIIIKGKSNNNFNNNNKHLHLMHGFLSVNSIAKIKNKMKKKSLNLYTNNSNG